MPPAKKRKLGDLYVIGKQVTFDDELGDPIVVWIQKLNSTEIDACLVRANAKRAMAERYADDPDSVAYLDTYAEVLKFDSHSLLVEIAIQEDLADKRQQATAKLEHSEEWGGDDDLVSSLVAAWEGDEETGLVALKDVYAEGPESDNPLYQEAKDVYDQLDKFDSQVEAAIVDEKDALIRDLATTSMAELTDIVTRKMLKRKATGIFVDEYKLASLWEAVRDDDNRKDRYFDKPDDLTTLQDEVLKRLRLEYDMLEVTTAEGKGLPGNPASSDSSAPPETPETEASSGPLVATR